MILTNSSFAWEERTFTVSLNRGGTLGYDDQFNVSAALFRGTQQQKKRLGSLKGYLLPRPCQNFHEFADEVSQEMSDLSCIFCESNGVTSRVQNNPKMTRNAVVGGGFLNVKVVEIKPELNCQDLGLRFLHEVLVQLRGLWTLMAMIPCSLSESYCEWKANYCPLPGGPLDTCIKLTPEQSQSSELHSKQVMRHFARMGFVQAGKKSDEVDAWFLTSSNYFASGANPIASWLSKQQAADIVIYESPTAVEITGLDKDLLDTVVAFSAFCDDAGPMQKRVELIRKVEDLVRRGASVNQLCSLQSTAANTKDSQMLHNHRDEFGNSALHLAAAFQQSKNIEYLCNVGADKSALNVDGETPLQHLQKAIQSTADFRGAFGLVSLPVKESDCVPSLRCLTALMPPEQRSLLIDGWMSPQMKYMLDITASLQMDIILGGHGGGFV